MTTAGFAGFAAEYQHAPAKKGGQELCLQTGQIMQTLKVSLTQILRSPLMDLKFKI
jgi:hypothetical protein